MAKLVNGRWSGKLGRWVYRRDGTRRRYVRCPAPSTRPQERMRRLLKRLAAEWRRLSPIEQMRWNRSRVARRRHWSGYTAFVAAGLRLNGPVHPRRQPLDTAHTRVGYGPDLEGGAAVSDFFIGAPPLDG